MKSLSWSGRCEYRSSWVVRCGHGDVRQVGLRASRAIDTTWTWIERARSAKPKAKDSV